MTTVVRLFAQNSVILKLVVGYAKLYNCKFWLIWKKGEVVYGGHCICHPVYYYAVDLDL